jgi:nitrate/nitrite transporter NarK
LLSIWGFVFIAISFAALALAVGAFPNDHDGLKFALFALVVVSLNSGPIVSTYVLPASLFPKNVRGTFHGLSAASGKAGAVVGAFIFPPMVSSVGIGGVMWIQVFVALLGAAVSVLFLADEPQPQLPP